MKAGKAWGTTELILATPVFEHHRIEIKAGGYCSIHRHKTKANAFYLERGRLLIHVWHGDVIDTTELRDGQATTVPAGVKHQFEAVDDCIAFETYWAEYSPDDIERESEGGMRKPFIGK